MSKDDYDVTVTRRHRELPPPFVCVICEREIEARPWADYEREPYQHRPPVCHVCSDYGRIGGNTVGLTRGDCHALARLAVMAGAMTRESWWHAFAD